MSEVGSCSGFLFPKSPTHQADILSADVGLIGVKTIVTIFAFHRDTNSYFNSHKDTNGHSFWSFLRRIFIAFQPSLCSRSWFHKSLSFLWVLLSRDVICTSISTCASLHVVFIALRIFLGYTSHINPPCNYFLYLCDTWNTSQVSLMASGVSIGNQTSILRLLPNLYMDRRNASVNKFKTIISNSVTHKSSAQPYLTWP